MHTVFVSRGGERCGSRLGARWETFCRDGRAVRWLGGGVAEISSKCYNYRKRKISFVKMKKIIDLIHFPNVWSWLFLLARESNFFSCAVNLGAHVVTMCTLHRMVRLLMVVTASVDG